MIEKRRFSSVRISYQSNDGPRRTLAPVPMQTSRLLHLLELAADFGHPLANEPPVGLDLGFSRTSEEAEAAALPLEVGPAPDEAARLVIKMCELHLQPTFGGCSALSEDLENETGSVDHLRPDLFLQIFLLNRGQRGIDDEESCAFLPREFGHFLDLALPEEGRGPDRPNAKRSLGNDVDADRFRQAFRLLDARFSRAPGGFAGKFRDRDDRAFAARDLDRTIAVESVQDEPSSPSSFCSGSRVRAFAGWSVEIACL
jgi:hypothetical protein